MVIGQDLVSAIRLLRFYRLRSVISPVRIDGARTTGTRPSDCDIGRKLQRRPLIDCGGRGRGDYDLSKGRDAAKKHQEKRDLISNLCPITNSFYHMGFHYAARSLTSIPRRRFLV